MVIFRRVILHHNGLVCQPHIFFTKLKMGYEMLARNARMRAHRKVGSTQAESSTSQDISTKVVSRDHKRDIVLEQAKKLSARESKGLRFNININICSFLDVMIFDDYANNRLFHTK